MAAIESYRIPAFDEIELALTADAPRSWGLGTSRSLALAVEPNESGLWLVWPAGEMLLALPPVTSVIEATLVTIDGVRHYRLGARSPRLIREIYYFLSGIVHRAEESEEDFFDAIRSELNAWQALLRQPPTLDQNMQVGLLGELWVLWRIAGKLDHFAVECWNGPVSEQHDFRLDKEDLEVKTTLAHTRDHVISDLGQLVTTSYRPLSVVSIQLKPAGGGPGTSLKQAIDRIAERFASNNSALQKFEAKLASLGYREADADRYEDRFCLRTVPLRVPVDADFPRLTREALEATMPESVLQRVRKVLYTVNLDGLGKSLDALSVHDSLHDSESRDLYA